MVAIEMDLTRISGEAWWRSPYWQGELPGFERRAALYDHWNGTCAICGEVSRGQVAAEGGVPAHFCRQCELHCRLRVFLRKRGKLA